MEQRPTAGADSDSHPHLIVIELEARALVQALIKLAPDITLYENILQLSGSCQNTLHICRLLDNGHNHHLQPANAQMSRSNHQRLQLPCHNTQSDSKL